MWEKVAPAVIAGLLMAGLVLYGDVQGIKSELQALRVGADSLYTQKHAGKLEKRVYRLESESCFESKE